MATAQAQAIDPLVAAVLRECDDESQWEAGAVGGYICITTPRQDSKTEPKLMLLEDGRFLVDGRDPGIDLTANDRGQLSAAADKILKSVASKNQKQRYDRALARLTKDQA